MKYAVLFVATVFSACASVSGTRDADLDEGEFRIFRAPSVETRAAAAWALEEAGLDTEAEEEVEPGTWMIVGTRGGGVLAYGEIVRVVVTRENEGLSRVLVLTRKRSSVNVFAEDDYSDQIFELLESELGSPLTPFD